MDHPTGQGALGFRLIGASKLLTSLLLAGASFGIFRLLNRDLGTALEQFASRLHLDPDNWVVHASIGRVAGLDRAHLKAIGAGGLFYAALEAVEGVGLLLRRGWAKYLTVIATGLLLPLEIFEITRKPNAMRVAILLVNLAILAYLIVKLWQETRSRSGRQAVPAGRV